MSGGDKDSSGRYWYGGTGNLTATAKATSTSVTFNFQTSHGFSQSNIKITYTQEGYFD